MAASRLERLRGYLEADPHNLALIEDAATAALDESALEVAADLIARYRALAALPPGLVNAEGMVAMRSGDYATARAAFVSLRDAGHDHPVVRFNLAWLSALEGRFADIPELVDDAVIGGVPRAAALKVQAMHHLGDVDGAVELGRRLVERLPHDDALLGALSVAAMDVDDLALAAEMAGRAGGGADALTTRGLFALDGGEPRQALELFDRALVEHPHAPRAWLGKGLGLLAMGDADAAAPCLEEGARIFDDHLGSWIAAGWAQFIRRDLAAARRDFERAMTHDENFAETHGALAVLDLAEGKFDSARRRSEVALKLDRTCFGGALARALLLETEGRPALAERVRRRALELPVGVEGKTLLQTISGIAGARSGGRLN
ncbi:MAG: tetratricopeptide repeat protein [Novosphingobium sp.]